MVESKLGALGKKILLLEYVCTNFDITAKELYIYHEFLQKYINFSAFKSSPGLLK
jgi:hypothetical protein